MNATAHYVSELEGMILTKSECTMVNNVFRFLKEVCSLT